PNGRTQRQTALTAPGVTGEEIVHWSTFSLSARNPMNEAVRQRRLIEVDTFEEFAACWPQLAQSAAALDAHAYIALPLEFGGRLVGSIGYHLRKPGPLSDSAREFVLSLANLTAQALERARLYEQEHAARTEAEQANRAKSDFLAVVSHELRTPLNTITGYVDLMLTGAHGPLPEEYADYADRIRSAQKYLVGLIDNVMRFAKIESQQIAYDIGVYSVAELLRALVPLVELQVNARNIAFVIEAGDPAQCVRADREKVIQILLNLVANSLKYTDRGGMVAVTTSCTGSAVDIRVTDTGRGIPNDRLESIFEPFVQVDSSLTRDGEGVGLGLAISRELARGMGGELEAVSTLGLGSCFTLYLPAA
ncbi:MAG: sensor histidine kinase, partial [Longimicrobiales bacterium]